MAAARALEVEVQGRRLRLSNLDKLMYPKAAFTKGHVIDYYTRVAPYVLAHLADRPLTLKRYPNGVEGGHFYEKNCPRHRPEWVRTAPIWSRHTQRDIDFCVVDDIATLVWLANLADLELHTSMSKVQDVEAPTMVVFDLDPGAPADILDCCQVALWLRELLDRLGLESCPKTSGSKGLQLYVPLNAPHTYDQTKPFALALAELLEQRHPDRVVSRMAKALRPGKVLVDWSQNDAAKTTVCVYSLRARERPTVSTPVRWEEVEAALAAGDPACLSYEAAEVLERCAEHGDLFARTLTVEQELPPLGDPEHARRRVREESPHGRRRAAGAG
jgi:bifunctional non-homologous end joining protein LigD